VTYNTLRDDRYMRNDGCEAESIVGSISAAKRNENKTLNLRYGATPFSEIVFTSPFNYDNFTKIVAS